MGLLGNKRQASDFSCKWSIPEDILCKVIADVADELGNWKWASFEHLLPHHIILRIASFQLPLLNGGEDKVCWAESRRGIFTGKSAYHATSHHGFNKEDQTWSLAWKWQGPQCIHMFLWLVLHDRLKTNGELQRRHIVAGSGCARCGASLENTLPVLRDCMVARRFWNRIVPEQNKPAFYSLNLRKWMCANLKSGWTFKQNVSWRCFFGVAIWKLWQGRNLFNFNHISVDSEHMVNDVSMRAMEIHRIHNSLMCTGIERSVQWIAWSPPIWPWCKLNTDGAAKSTGASSAGGLIRDHNGNWLAGFCMNIGSCSVMVAEFWGLLQGLSIAWEKGIRWLNVEVDSLCNSTAD